MRPESPVVSPRASAAKAVYRSPLPESNAASTDTPLSSNAAVNPRAFDPPTLVCGSRPKVMVFQYGCRVDDEAIKTAQEQFFKAHTLYNALVAKIREISQAARECVMNAAPEEAHALQSTIDALTVDFAAAKAADDEPKMKDIAAARKAAWIAMKPLLKSARTAIKTQLKDDYYSRIGKNVGTDTYSIKVAAVAAGLGGDTASDVLDSALQAYEKSMAKGGMPHFRRAHEVTSETLMIAAHRGGGIPTEAFTSGNYMPVQIKLRGDVRRRVYHPFEFRAGAASEKRWISGTVEMHRALPLHAGVAEVRLKRARIGNAYRWYLQFVCVMSEQSFEQPSAAAERPPKKPLAAVHFGWAQRDDGREIAAIADGNDAANVTMIHLPTSIEHTLDAAEAKQSERDHWFNQNIEAMRESLRALLPANLEDPSTRPNTANALALATNEILQARVLAMWRTRATHISHSKLHALIIALQQAGVEDSVLTRWANGDNDMKGDLSMWSSHSHGVRRASMQRRSFYREVAAKLAREYDAVVISDIDLAEAAVKVNTATGEKSDFNAAARSGRVRAALSQLKDAIKNAFAREGGVVLASNYDAVASICSDCGSSHLLTDDADHLQQRCQDCGAKHHRKVNAARNLWRSVDGGDDIVGSARVEAAEKEAAAALAKVERLKKMQDAKRKKSDESNALKR
jgi:Putative transposase DNA-binding domain